MDNWSNARFGLVAACQPQAQQHEATVIVMLGSVHQIQVHMRMHMQEDGQHHV